MTIAWQQEECVGLDNGPVTFSELNCRPGWTEISNSCYQVGESASDHATAVQECISRNSRLAWVETRYKLCRLGELIDDVKGSPRNTVFWLGAIRNTGNSQIHWVESDGITLGKTL